MSDEKESRRIQEHTSRRMRAAVVDHVVTRLDAVDHAVVTAVASADLTALRSEGLVLDGHGAPVFVFVVPGDAPDVLLRGIVPYAWDCFFGASFTLTAYTDAAVCRVTLGQRAPILEQLRVGAYVAVFSDVRGRILAAFEVDALRNPGSREFLWAQLDLIRGCRPVFADDAAHRYEMLDEASKTLHLSLTRAERNGVAWMLWYSGVVRIERDALDGLHDQLLSAAPETLPEPFARIAIRYLEELPDLSGAAALVGEFVQESSPGAWFEACDDAGVHPLWSLWRRVFSSAMRVYWEGSVASRSGARLASLDVRGRMRYIDLDLASIDQVCGVGEYWNRLFPSFRLNAALLLGGGDIPVAPEVFDGEHAGGLPRADDVPAVDQSTTTLLKEAISHKRWTIPSGACVQIPLGPFSYIEMSELPNGDVIAACRTDSGEYFMVGIEPGKAYFDLDLPLPPDEPATVKIESAVRMLLAAVVHDFWVLERRESVFGERRGKATGWGRGGDSTPRVVYLPRVRYERTSDSYHAPISGGRAQGHMREHRVGGHLRRVGRSSAAQVELAQQYGFSVPQGYTFVRPHARGADAREVVYRSRSALQSLYAAMDAGAAERVEAPTLERLGVHWFEFERDVASMLRRQGFVVEHVAASRRGDRGIDVYAQSEAAEDASCWVIQCKCWSLRRKVGPDVVRELVGALQEHPPGTRGMIVTTSTFTLGARKDAESAQIRLIDGEEYLRLSRA